MSDVADRGTEDAPRKGGKRGLILAGVLGLALAGGGFMAARTGLIPAFSPKTPESGLGDIAYVTIPPLVLSLGPGMAGRHLPFAADLEVRRADAREVTLVMPRIRDVLNGYLRAVEPERLEQPAMLMTLRAQMLRRVQIVAGEGRVRDLLVSEFVIN